MNKVLFTFLTMALLALGANPTAFAGSEHNMPLAAAPKDFDSMKNFVGVWEGKDTSGKMGDTPTTVEYVSTAGGTAIVEKLFPGTPHEMTSVYFYEGDKVGMTHYCMIGNHPKMMLNNHKKNSWHFEMADSTGLATATEPHMHALTITMKDNDHMVHEWVSYENGKAKETSTFKFTRKK